MIATDRNAALLSLRFRDHEFRDRISADDVPRQNLFKHFRRTVAVPNAIGHHDRDRPADTDADALHLDPHDAQTVFSLQFLETPFEEFPRLHHLLVARALCRFAVHAQQDRPRVVGQTEFSRPFSGRVNLRRFQKLLLE